MKSVLMSISPYWYYLIGENIKTIEVRKTIPRANDWNGIVECYMTKDMKSFSRIPKEFQAKYAPQMGKVGMKFVCDDVFACKYDYSDGVDIDDDSLLFARLERDEINIYAKGKTIYCWYISDLKIYDKTLELREFYAEGECKCTNCYKCPFFERGNGFNLEDDCGFFEAGSYHPITRPPQSWCYVEEV